MRELIAPASCIQIRYPCPNKLQIITPNYTKNPNNPLCYSSRLQKSSIHLA